METTQNMIRVLESKIAEANAFLQNLTNQLADLKRRAEEESKVGLKKVLEASTGFRLYQTWEGVFCIDHVSNHGRLSKDSDGVLFESQSQAQAFGKAFQVMLEMRAQPGVMAPSSKEKSWCIIPLRNGEVQWIGSVCTDAIPSTLFARFRSKEEAEAAVNAVGKERIIQTARTLSFVEEYHVSS